MLMTERLYWNYPEISRFSAKLVKSRLVTYEKDDKKDRGSLVKVWLDRTLFYPEGGGQPCDVGFLTVQGVDGSLPVRRVTEEDGEIVHYVYCSAGKLDGLVATVGNDVCGEIDWQCRFDHMQQHTGQHILSQAFLRTLEAHTVGFHLSSEHVSIDLDACQVTQATVQEAERLANEVVFGNIPVKAAEYAPDDLPNMVRRRLPKETETIRVIEIGDFDSCACGGTHVISTGQIGLIKVNEVVGAHGGMRVFFRCGWRALADYQSKNETALVCSRLLSIPVSEMDIGIKDLQAKVEEQERQIKQQKRKVLELEAANLASEAATLQDIFVKAIPGKDSEEIRALAKEVTAISSRPTVLFSRTPKFCVAIAGPGKDFDAGAVAQLLANAFGARGGGSRTLAQVGSKEALEVTDEETKERIRCLYNKCLRKG